MDEILNYSDKMQLSILLSGSYTVEQVAKALAEFIGHDLVKNPNVDWDLYVTWIVGLKLYIKSTEGFEDDRDVKFTQYSTIIDIEEVYWKIPEIGNGNWSYRFALVAGSYLSDRLDIECLIIDDLHIIVTKINHN